MQDAKKAKQTLLKLTSAIPKSPQLSTSVMPPELNLKIGVLAGIDATSKSARTCKFFNAIHFVLFSNTKTKSGDKRAIELKAKADTTALFLFAPNLKNPNNKLQSAACFNYFQSLHQAFVFANDEKLKIEIYLLYKNQLKMMKNYICDEADQIKILLFGLRLNSDTIDLFTVGMSTHIDRRKLLLKRFHELMDNTKNSQLKFNIAREALYAINYLMNHVPPTFSDAPDKQLKFKNEYLSEMGNIKTEWEIISNKLKSSTPQITLTRKPGK